MREGGRRHAEILRALAGFSKPGISTEELEDKARKLIEEAGGKPAHLHYTPRGARRPFPAALCVSINEEIVHGIPNEQPKVLKDGDLVTIDLSIFYNGLVTDSAITVPVGKIDEESKKLLEVTSRALDTGIREAVAGGHIGDIGAAITDVVEAGGFKVAEDLAGHGLGFELHEEPLVPNTGERGKGEKLVPGMVIAIEPMVTAGSPGIKVLKDGYTIVTRDGSRSAHFEHTVAITNDGNIVLTKE